MPGRVHARVVFLDHLKDKTDFKLFGLIHVHECGSACCLLVSGESLSNKVPKVKGHGPAGRQLPANVTFSPQRVLAVFLFLSLFFCNAIVALCVCPSVAPPTGPGR